MSTSGISLADATELDPREAAAKLAAAHQNEPGWLDEFTEYLDRHRAGQSLARTLTVWDLNQSQAARLFGVTLDRVSQMRRSSPSSTMPVSP